MRRKVLRYLAPHCVCRAPAAVRSRACVHTNPFAPSATSANSASRTRRVRLLIKSQADAIAIHRAIAQKFQLPINPEIYGTGC